MRARGTCVVLVLVLGMGRVGAAEPACSLDCLSLDCHLRAGTCYLQSDQPAEAKKLLKPLMERHPDSLELKLLVAKAYLMLGNLIWSMRVLGMAAMQYPQNCQVRSWLVWVHLKSAVLDEAEQLLQEEGCPDSKPMRGRWHLLQATLARHRQQDQGADRHVQQALETGRLYPEDQNLLDSLKRHVSAGPLVVPVELRLQLAGGYTSNGIMGSPADLASSDLETGSPTLSLDAQVRLQAPWRNRVRPLLELGLRGLVLSEETISDYSYYSFNLRPGLALGPVHLFYSGQLFLLSGGDDYTDGEGPRWFYEAHRAELEWEPAPWLSMWGGAGRALFREQVRTRWEGDLGAALATRLGRLRLVGALSWRGHWAHAQAYDLQGGTLLALVSHPLGSWGLVKARFLLSIDYFPYSLGDFTIDEYRRDLLLKGGAEIWSRPWHGLRAGLIYEPAHRFSTAQSYRYTDHRILAGLRFTQNFDPWAPGTVAGERTHVSLPYDVTQSDDMEDERIQELLRQEDAARRGSSCID